MSSISRYSIRWRRWIHKPLAAIFTLTLRPKVKLLRNDAINNGKPTIYAVTHVFYDDISAVCCCLRQSAYVLLGVEGGDNIPTMTDRLALTLNGVIVVDRRYKKSRANSANEMISVLNNKGNVLIFPEGAWNLSPNLLAQKLNWNLLKIAMQTNSNIIPVAVDIVENSYCVIIGDCFEYPDYTDHTEAITALRDALATLVWELICMKPPLKKCGLSDFYWLNHIHAQSSKMPQQDQTKEESYVYRPKGEISLGELLADMHGIEYKSMAADYEQHKKIMSLCDNWNKPINIRYGRFHTLLHNYREERTY